jgi:ABC-type uncharacterized transport system substrate-binding protein
MKRKAEWAEGGGMDGVLRAVFMVLFAGAWAGCRLELPPKVVDDPQAGTQRLAQHRDGRYSETTDVFVVHSYSPDFEWVQAIDRGMDERFAENPSLKVRRFYLNTKHRTDENWKRSAAGKALAAVEAYRPKVVIAVDDNAQQYFVLELPTYHPPVVFCGVNADPAKYGYPAETITGVIERPHLDELLASAGELFDLRKVLFLSSDDPTSAGAMSYLRQVYRGNIQIEWKLVGSLDDWKDAVIGAAKKDVDAIIIFNYHTLRRSGETMSVAPDDVIRWTVDHAEVPLLTFADFAVQRGVALAVAVSGEEQGQLAADYALAILGGREPVDLPIMHGSSGNRLVNESTLARLGVSIPASWYRDTRVYTKEGTWQSKWQKE